MFDIGWSEMAVVALLALIVIGPKDLPRVLRSASHWVRKARGLAREFQSGVDEMIREADLEDAKKAIEKTTRFDVDQAVENAIDPTGSVKDEARDIEAAAKPSEPDAPDHPAPDDGAGEAPAEGGDSEEEPKATIIKHPVRMAPPHSVTPPPEGDAAAPAPDDDSSKKRA
ncbi:MAG: Sec-independent protein translocase protein TatB [Rhodospirillales bacterium]|nr:Sec-independent protein translocase protein TatB [Rhodospirillales bacterium]MDH3791523.1 Sec-independent protein translocase protein TatB [Rhodospirillales bacterium]MDH3912141.1 Sec-independent protein translocase protein TatB [Rhodospirillales bacterium]MDH3917225.1 Sec-independent protein translocase protein TatB [Rhodospirillales bacterium]MDH3968517.1 Sec-independent protein translocase protein TatB [Rhodospirillales bacterium]